MDHATGLISAIDHSIELQEDPGRQMDPRVIEADDWYEVFAQAGLGYGLSFQGISQSQLLCDPVKNIATADVNLNTTQRMFKGPESRYMIHPASLDICLQLAIIACHGGQTQNFKTGPLPVFIDEITVWPSGVGEQSGRAAATAHFKGLRGAHAQIQVLTQFGKPLLDIRKIRTLSYIGGEQNTGPLQKSQNPYTRLVWKPDISTLTNSKARELFPPKIPAGEVSDTFELMNKASVYMIAEIATIRQTYPAHLSQSDPLHRIITWAERSAAQDHPLAKAAWEMSSAQRQTEIQIIAELLSNIVYVKHTHHIFRSLPDILTGTTTGIEVAVASNVLEDLYTSGLGISAAYPQLERILNLLGHRNPSLKILEIGAGTGSATQVALKALGRDGDSKQYREYVFTDISSGFLQSAQRKLGSFKDVSYATFDFTRHPTEQGFDGGFDLIIASECLHTAKDVHRTLRNLRGVLNEGGRMILLETTRTFPGHGIAYGTFPDYWPDADVSNSPFITIEQWSNALQQTGFSGVDIGLDDYPPPLRIASTLLTTAVGPPFPQRKKLVETLASILCSHSITPVLSTLEDCNLPQGSRVVFATHVGANPLVDGSESEYEKTKEIISRSSSMLWLTDGDILRGSDSKAAVITGLVRMLITEDSASHYGILHLESESDPSDQDLANQIVDREHRLYSGDFEREIAIHKGIANISRLLVDPDLSRRFRFMNDFESKVEELPLQPFGPMRVEFETPGLLSSLYFRADESFESSLKDDWIEVRTAAIGLNWKDVATSAGRLDLDHFNCEFSGIVTSCGNTVTSFQPGDKVYGFALRTFGTFLRIPAVLAKRVPPHLDVAVMSTVPVIFVTALYALNHLARLKRDERLAQKIGAEVYATAGSSEKAAYLENHYGLSPDRFFSSRSTADMCKMMKATTGLGFDVVLGSSTGNVMHESWRCIAKRGRFIDVGRVDVQNHTSMAMEIFNRNATFSSFDLGSIVLEEEQFAGSLLNEVNDMMHQGCLRPLTAITSYDVSELSSALLNLSKGKHIGKSMVTYHGDNLVKIRTPPPRARFNKSAVYVLVGGLGGLGRSILQWMVDHDAQQVVVFNRSGKSPEEATILLHEMARQNITIEILQCDVTSKEQVFTSMGLAMEHGPIKGILHAAWNHGLSAKVLGAFNLHDAAESMQLNLDFFVMTSSFMAVVALPTTAAYCAANCFQDAFARFRRS
ncbi:KR domain-domain-containing protein [Clohesyomyces aquaticus]|uniref:KR domain-domain-containing protein n=1 Tax=Clohesyomyces aquaticus TaxID=1231657 RepID=A0A1Y1ZH46_9PLEO|nr:KR domain-domain-containing protein [Clohesyomyces aquaticus]